MTNTKLLKNFDTSEHATIEKYVADKKLKGFYTESGIFVSLNNNNGKKHPNINSKIKVHYKGYFLDGNFFDATKPHKSMEFNLKQLIKGWQEALLYFTKGSSGTLIIPSEMAYGKTGAGNIKPNSIIAFDIQLISIKKSK